MHTYILKRGGGTAGGEEGREEIHLSASALEQLNLGGGGSQAASEPDSERGTAVVEKAHTRDSVTVAGVWQQGRAWEVWLLIDSV